MMPIEADAGGLGKRLTNRSRDALVSFREIRNREVLRHGDSLPVSRLRVKLTPFFEKLVRFLFEADLPAGGMICKSGSAAAGHLAHPVIPFGNWILAIGLLRAS
jgi:hypothetical protein